MSDVAQLVVRIPERLHRDVKIVAALTGVSMQEFVTKALEQKLNTPEATAEIWDIVTPMRVRE